MRKSHPNLPNPSPVIDTLCPLPTQAPTKSPQQESFLERLGSSSQGKKAIPVVVPWSIADVIPHRWLIYPPVREITHFSAWDLAKEEVKYSLCQAIHNPHRIVLNSHLLSDALESVKRKAKGTIWLSTPHFLPICKTKNFTERNPEFSVTHHLFQTKQSQILVL